MRESQFAKNLTHKQLYSFLRQIGFNNPIFVIKDDVPSPLANFYDFSIKSTQNSEDEVVYAFFTDDNKFYLMLYSDFYLTIYGIVTLKNLTLEVNVVPHNPQKYKLTWDHFLFNLFKEEYEIFWWSERFISRDKLIETLKVRLREFDNESNKAIERIKEGP